MTSTIKVDTISEKTSANGVAIDSVTLKDGGIAATAASTITTADNSDTLTLKSTDADANAGPVLVLNRDSASPADNDFLGHIKFVGDDDAGNATTFFEILTKSTDVSDGSEVSRVEFNAMIAGSATSVMQVRDTEFIFNQDSADYDFRVESNGNTHMLFVDGGNDKIGVGTSSPQTTLHLEATAPILRISDSNSTSEDDAVGKIQFYDRNNTDLNAEIIAGDGSLSNLILSAHNNRAVVLQTNGNNERFRAHGDGTLSTGGETVTDVNIGGLTLQMNANDGGFFSAKSSDIAHGITGTAETDTFVKFSKHSATNGGISIIGLTEATECIKLNANPTNAVTDQNGTSVGAHIISVSKKSGSGTGSFDGTGNILSIANHTATRFHFRGDGNFYADAGSNTFDEFEDAHLVRAYDLSHGKGVINSKFDDYVKYNHEKLAELDLVGREEDGTPNHFVNVTGFQRLHNGAIWQQYEKHQRLAEAVYEMAKETLGADKADAILKKHDIKLLN